MHMNSKKITPIASLFFIAPLTAQKDAVEKERIIYEIISDYLDLKRNLDTVLKQARKKDDCDTILKFNHRFNNIRDQYEQVLEDLTGRMISLSSIDNKTNTIDVCFITQKILSDQ